MTANPYQQYKRKKYETQDQTKLLLMLYEGAIKFCKQAKIAIENDDPIEKNNKLQRAQDVIHELIDSLDTDNGGEVADNLLRLYEYMLRRLIKANIKQDTEIVDEVLDLLNNLYQGWQGAAKKVRENKGSKQSNKNNFNSAQTQQQRGGAINIEG